MAIYVMSHAGHVTGGPESSHQLVHKARSLGLDAYIYYFSGHESDRVVPEAYRHYDVEVARQVVEDPDSILIIPEVIPFYLNGIHECRKVIWWLSVDNFTIAGENLRTYQNRPSDRDAFDFVFDPRQKITHLTHSDYGRRYLATKGVKATLLGDYISDKITVGCADLARAEKFDQIAYNPKKGQEFTRALIQASAGSLKWVPIQGMTAEGVAKTLSESKLYIDFGEHPGQDHLPKEAALAGSCVLTGTRGAAANSWDVPIPDRFKMNEASEGAIERVLDTIRWIFANHTELAPQFDEYRAWILSHEKKFEAQINEIFGSSGILPPKAKRR